MCMRCAGAHYILNIVVVVIALSFAHGAHAIFPFVTRAHVDVITGAHTVVPVVAECFLGFERPGTRESIITKNKHGLFGQIASGLLEHVIILRRKLRCDCFGTVEALFSAL